MSEESKRKFNELNMTKDELDRFSEAMKKEEFRKLLVEYAEELSDPKNREQYEKEISQLEEERGMNVTFIHPEKGFCLKTTQNGDAKCFINICKNANIDKPSSQQDTQNKNGKVTKGLFWEIPHTCSPSREDLDHDKKKCIVYDVVFHPDSYRMGETNERFKELLKSSAMDTIEGSFKVKLDRVNAKELKNLAFKGRPTACVIKKKINDFEAKPLDADDPLRPLLEQVKEHNLDKQLSDRLDKAKKTDKKSVSPLDSNNNPQETRPDHTVPKYSIVHRGHTDMSDHAYQLDSTVINTTRPKEISISIELPLLKSSQNVNLDVFETTLDLSHEDPNYKLNIKLPYPVRESEAKAKFDKSKRCLNITLPVIPFIGKLNASPAHLISPVSDQPSSTSSMSSISSQSLSSTPPKESSPVHESKAKEELEGKMPEKATPVPSKETTPPMASKYKLPAKVEISETQSFISFKIWTNNYVKESLKIKIDSSSSLHLTFESCSLSGCYIQYFATTIKLTSSQLDSDLIVNSFRPVEDFNDINQSSFNFNNANKFEIKFKKTKTHNITSVDSQTAEYFLDKSDNSESHIVKITQDSTEEMVEHAQICEDKINNMSRKDYIMNFNNIVNENKDEDDDDEVQADESQISDVPKKSLTDLKSHEKIKYRSKQSTDEIETKPSKESEQSVENAQSQSDQDVSDYEKDYLANQLNSQNEGTNEENDADDDSDKKHNEPGSSSYSSSLMSSLNSTSSTHLKSILKKPRSYSESESSQGSMKNGSLTKFTPNFESGDIENSEDNLQGSKKSVHFNNQVVRNVFKSNSTVNGMKKPNSNKNRKKNQRKRTISDPTSDSTNEYSSLKDDHSSSGGNKLQALRSRSISESTDDDGAVMTPSSANSMESIDEEKTPKTENPNQSKNKNKKKKKKANNNNNSSTVSDQKKPDDNSQKSVEKPREEAKTFDVETMMQWKNQGLLPDDGTFAHTTECSFKFKNKIISDLDD